MSTLSTILAAILGVAFFGAGIQKLTGQKMVVENFKRWGYADVVLTATGWLEVITGAVLLVGIAVPSLAVTGSMLVIAIMLGALVDPSARARPDRDVDPAGGAARPGSGARVQPAAVGGV